MKCLIGAKSQGVWRAVKERILCILLASMMLNLILMSAVIVLSVRRQEPVPQNPIIRVESCPNGWIGFQRRCYYFADIGRNWTSSQKECSSLNASLAVIDSQVEMDFIKRYKDEGHHWIGLQRTLATEPWKWIRGSRFKNWFEVHGAGQCVYMDHNNIRSCGCRREKRWICSKAMESTLRPLNV